jgi:hypothetical protein
MIEYAIAAVLIAGLATRSFFEWLNRVHPAPTPVDVSVELQNKVKQLQEDLNEFKLDRGLRNQGD